MGMTDANERTFREFARELRRLNRSAKTISAYHQACLSLERWLDAEYEDGCDLLEVTREDLREWMIALQATHAADSIVTYFRSIRATYNWFSREGLLEDGNPAEGMKAPKGSGKPLHMPSDDDLRKLLGACQADKSWLGRRDEAIIRMMCQAGAPRAGEVAKLETSRVDMDAEVILLHGKTGYRQIPIELSTARAFSRWTRARNKLSGIKGQPRFFISATHGQPDMRGALTETGLYQMFERRSAEARIERIHPHQTRHWSTRQMKKRKIADGQIKVLNGWRTSAMLEQYGAELEAEDAIDCARQAGIGDVL